ncbi:DUF559 domain-containing protein [Williamsia sp. CHRR-6]|uniref:DUF559 domain-containing protein n=1 Tax=Williamsia sp. CHRR-6 TaxID=2835871 RepID=UPI001BDAAF73|nr:DUF559 domain-containing protein [Williamsia sp. CHRR-6]MBT0565911.1 DUF559 domain-containing protein [Williamsia sp. CHRR-6]
MTFTPHEFWGPSAHLFRSSELIEPNHGLRRIHRGVFADATAHLEAVDLIRAAVMRAGPGAVVAGTSAAILHGTHYVEQTDVELLRDLKGQGRNCNSVRIMRTDGLAPEDVTTAQSMAVTNPIRTAYDLGRRFPDWLALAHLDELTAVTGMDLKLLWVYIRDHPRSRGICQVRELIRWIDPLAESPGESWLRYVMIKDSLPRPELQIELRDRTGRVFARLDLGYRRYKVAVEYDGVNYHSTTDQVAYDEQLDRAAEALGWIVIRVTGAELASDPHAVTARIRRALEGRGWKR